MLGRTLRHDLAALEPDNELTAVDPTSAHLDEVGDEDDRAPFEKPVETMLYEVSGGVRVDRAEDVVEENNVAVRVHRTSEGDPLLLSSRHRQALLADSSLVAVRETFEIGLECAGVQRLLIPVFIKLLAEEDVGADRVVCEREEERSSAVLFSEVASQPTHLEAKATERRSWS